MFQNSPFIAVKKVPVEKKADVLGSVEDHIKIQKLCSLSIFIWLKRQTFTQSNALASHIEEPLLFSHSPG